MSLNDSWSEFQIENDSFLNSNFFHQLHHLPKPKSKSFILEERFSKKYKNNKKMEKSVDQMNVGRSYPLWDSFLDEKLKKLQISTDVKQEVNIIINPMFQTRPLIG